MHKKPITLSRNTLHVLDADIALPLVAGGGVPLRYIPTRGCETIRRGPTGGGIDR